MAFIPLRSVTRVTASALSPESTFCVEYLTGVSNEAPPPHCAVHLSFLSCANSIDTASPLYVFLASFSYTALLLLTSDSPPLFLSGVPLSGNQLHAPELGPLLVVLGPITCM